MLSCMKSMVYCITSTLCCPCRHWEDIVLGILLLIPLLAVPFLLISSGFSLPGMVSLLQRTEWKAF